MIGILVNNNGRPDIASYDGRLLGGLHCGDCFQIARENSWISVRLELVDDWVIVSERGIESVPYGANVKIE